ncbi:MAG: histidine phosphatase family protein [Fibrobacter sp.]|nr:histidine phosphatase family protein [Fibrobacter sp.]
MRKSMFGASRTFPAAAALAFSALLAACGSDSESVSSPDNTATSQEAVSTSSSQEEPSPASSDQETPTPASSGEQTPTSTDTTSPEKSAGSSSEQTPAQPLSTTSATSSATPLASSATSSATSPTSSAAESPVEVTLDKDGFATVADVYHSLAPTEKAVFIIRHSEREDAVTIETELTANGIKMAQDLGATLKSDEEFSYITSGFVRTNETANNISKGRGEATLPKLITNYDITGNWFLKITADELAQYGTNLGMRGGSVELMSHWAYGEPYADVLYELEPRAQEFMQSVILKNLPKWKRVSIMVSHDILVMPLAVFGSEKKVALKYYEDYHWINYIAGLAIIADEQNNLRYIPVKGAESGVIDYLAIYMEEYNKKK